jgi:hypothetical protein
MRTRATKEAA